MIIKVKVILEGIPATGNIINVECDESGVPNGYNKDNWINIFDDFDNYSDVYELVE
jgi:hypothetical protein